MTEDPMSQEELKAIDAVKIICEFLKSRDKLTHDEADALYEYAESVEKIDPMYWDMEDDIRAINEELDYVEIEGKKYLKSDILSNVKERKK